MARDLELEVHGEPAAAAAELLAAAARRGEEIALAGGSTPRAAYEHAARIQPDWSRAGVWWGDERCVAPDDDRSNFGMAREALLDRLAQQPRVHRIEGEVEPDEAAAAYDRELRGTLLDLVLLGVGPDGHTASLFPGSPALDERKRLAVAAPAGLEPLVTRVTLTVAALCSARTVVFLVAGEDKAEAVRRAFAGDLDPATPASLVRSEAGRTVAILDASAASLL